MRERNVDWIGKGQVCRHVVKRYEDFTWLTRFATSKVPAPTDRLQLKRCPKGAKAKSDEGSDQEPTKPVRLTHKIEMKVHERFQVHAK